MSWAAAVRLRNLDRLRDRSTDDLTQSNATERTRELTNTATQLYALVRLAPVGIVELDASGDLLTANDQFHALSGLRLDHSRGSGWAVTIHPDDMERLTAERAVRAVRVAEQEASATHARFEAAFESSPLGTAIVTLNGYVVEGHNGRSSWPGRPTERSTGPSRIFSSRASQRITVQTSARRLTSTRTSAQSGRCVASARTVSTSASPRSTRIPGSPACSTRLPSRQ
ncbi:PAS domain-containing protein [Cryobacterium sp. TMS1-13-1]|uniref:PAS domain-containing protein n=1 Tax=Cryobacterium sp. TMS1-13-1 TaxID=1259220 RepID=UPI003516BFE5